MATFPCPDFLRDCECENFPVRNFTQEEPDVPVFIGTFNNPPTTGTFFAPGCLAICESTESQEEADLCAERQAVDCSLELGGRESFESVLQNCTVECPDGTTFSELVSGGVVHSAWAKDANARAKALACKRATQKRICFLTDALLESICRDVVGLVTFEAFGGTEPYVFAHTGGTLPNGMIFDGNGTLSGTPNTAGEFVFEITVQDDIGSFQVKEFTLNIVAITSPTALPDGTQDAAYSYTLLTAGAVAVSWVHVSGAFPNGLLLDLETGILSSDEGGITEAGDFAFTLQANFGSGVACEKAFTLHIEPAVLILGYWTFDNITGPAGASVIQDETPNGFDLGADLLTSVAGKVNNAAAIDNASAFTGTTSFTPIEGFTVAGWLKLPVDTGNFGPLWVIDFSTNDISLQYNFGGTISLTSISPLTNITKTYPDDGQWHFIRCWYDGTDLKFQIDNGTIGSTTIGPPGAAVFNDFTIGFAATFASDRTYDETGFWPRALSDDEAADLWNGGNGITWGDPNMPP